jgi:hypothetical protein
VLFQDVGGEAVLLSLANETYFGLDEVGTRVWKLLTEDSDLRSAFDALLVEYEVPPEVLEHDLLDLVEKLVAAGLVSLE